jgi:hypothetical protein
MPFLGSPWSSTWNRKGVQTLSGRRVPASESLHEVLSGKKRRGVAVAVYRVTWRACTRRIGSASLHVESTPHNAPP